MAHWMRILLLVFLAAGVACSQQEPTAAERVRELESRIWSPYCPGRLLTDCNTRQSSELRTRISERVASGQSDAEITTWLRSNFGDEVLAAPAPGPRGLSIWLAPLAAILAGGVLVGGLVRRWSRPSDRPDAPGEISVEPVPDEERQMWVGRVRDEVERDLP